jgi:kumamolisin
VPDVAGKADLAGGYSMTVGGRDIAMGGTSAAAPLWAALLSVINAKTGTRAGWINPLLYRSSFREATRETTRGTNGVYHAGEGWNACTGWGSPKGQQLLAALSGGAQRAATTR